MSKRLEDFVFHALKAAISDLVAQCPTTIAGVERDLTRLSVSINARGLTVLTVDLPNLGKHFTASLAAGEYLHASGPFSKGINSATPIPRLFQGFMLQVFERDGMLKAKPCTHCIAALHQIYNLAKKLQMPCADSAVYQTIAEFYAVESSLPEPTNTWDEEYCDPVSVTLDTYHTQDCDLSPSDLSVCQSVFDILSSLIGVFDPYQAKYKHGPGAVSDLTLGKAYKYDFPTWSDRLGVIFPVADFAYANWNLWADAVRSGDYPKNLDMPSKLICVPKTMKGPRLIACEPTASQFCQQAIAGFLADRFDATLIGRSIHLRDQTLNQQAALRASGDGLHWTVDLSAASDRVTLRLVERLFRSNRSLLDALMASRTPFLSQDIDKKYPSVTKLKKFSMMGSACTFPLQSLIFFGMAVSASLIVMRWKPTIENIRLVGEQVLVFGDDCIVHRDYGPMFEKLLTSFDFKVNASKTFREGKFRESCGLDAYDGVDITPAYVRQLPDKRKPDSIVSSVATSNNFFLKGLWRCADYLRNRVPQVGIPVVAVESGVLGFKSFVGTSLQRVKWDNILQKAYIAATVVTTKSNAVQPGTRGQLLQYFTEDPSLSQLSGWVSGYSGRPRLNLRRGRVYVEQLGRTLVA